MIRIHHPLDQRDRAAAMVSLARTGAWLLIVLAVACTGAPAAVSQESQRETKKQTDSARGKPLPGVTPEREAAVMTFVQQHHPELTKLLSYLRSNEPRQYQRAVRELARTVERLAQIHERDLDRHDLELRAWKARSRVDVLIAQWRIESSEQLQAKLRAALVEQDRVRIEFLRRERERLLERIEKLDAQIEQADAAREQDIESRLRALAKTPRRTDPTKARGSKGRVPSKPTKKSDKGP